jgi:putative ABC transport system substrate-binding protein
MRRREFITLLGASAAAWPLAARAQQTGAIRRIGVWVGVGEHDPEAQPRVAAFQQGLRELGWIEDRNIRIDFHWDTSDVSRRDITAKELIDLAPDVLLAESTPAVSALQRATHTIPIVFLYASNPVGSGFIASLAHPGGNITGFTIFEPSMGGKWLEVLKEIAPLTSRVAAIFNPQTHTGMYFPTLETFASSLGLELIVAPVQNISEIEQAIVDVAREANGGVLVLPDVFTVVHRAPVIALTARHRVPAVYAYRFFVTGGGLVSYGSDILDGYRRAATYVDRILKGERASDLPVQAPTKYQLVINLKTAKALGLTVPPTLLVAADEVIE